MAKLPTVESFDQRPTPRAPRSVIPIRADIAENAEAKGSRQVAKAAGHTAAAFAELSAQIREAEERKRAQASTIERARDVDGYTEDSAGKFLKFETEGDPTKPEELKSFIQGRTKKLHEILKAHSGTPESQARLTTQLTSIRTRYVNAATLLSVRTRGKLVAQAAISQLNGLVADAYETPANLPALFDSLDDIVDDKTGAMTTEQQLFLQTTGRDQIAKSAVESFLDVGAFREAQTILDGAPGIMGSLSPESQRSLKGRIAVFERAEIKARTTGETKLRELETILGRKATPAERVRAAGVAPPDGRQTPASKIEEMEAALDRPLTDPERERVAGLGQPAAVSPEGKVVQDREMFVGEFGEDSAQVIAFDEATQDTGPPSLADVAGQRKEFTKLSLIFVNVRDSFNRVVASAQNPSAAGDLAMIFNFMKILDPGSVVRESEFAQAAATGGFGERLKAAAERLIAGKRLSDVMRTDFRERAEMLMQVQARTQIRLEAQFRALAVRSGLDPAQVVIDFVGPFRATVGGQPLPEGGDGGDRGSRSAPRFKVDLQGNIIAGP